MGTEVWKTIKYFTHSFKGTWNTFYVSNVLAAVRTTKKYKTLPAFKEFPAQPGGKNSNRRAVNDTLRTLRAGTVSCSQVVYTECLSH